MPRFAKAMILFFMLSITYSSGAFAADDSRSTYSIDIDEQAQPGACDVAEKLVVQAARSRPSISISNQNVEDAHGTAIIKEAYSIGPGWLVIYNDGNAHPDRPTHAQGIIVGRTRLSSGSNKNIKVKLNMAFITPKLYAVVHKDSGRAGAFEYPGPDSPCPLSSRGGVTRQFYSVWPRSKSEFPKQIMSTGRYLEPP